ncbi:YdaS family helix-turn-helix protein [Gluconacetobacter entanii]
MNEIVRKAVNAAGGPTIVAKRLGIKVPSIYSWSRIPAEHVLTIARLSGMSPHEIRPDVFGPEPIASGLAACTTRWWRIPPAMDAYAGQQGAA